MKKRFFSVILLVTMLLTLLPSTLLIAEATETKWDVINTKGIVGSDIVTQARKYLGVPYDTSGGNYKYRTGFGSTMMFDCSGFVYRVCRDVGLASSRKNYTMGVNDSNGNPLEGQDAYGNYYITAHTQEQRYYGEDISSAVNKYIQSGDYSDLRPGDLLFITNNNSSVSHVVIYAGNGTIVHSEGYAGCVSEHSISRYHSNNNKNNWYFDGCRLVDSSSGDTNYLTQCPSEPTYCSLEITKKTTIKTLPCSKDTCAESGDIATLSSGTLTSTRIYKNTANNYWYQVSYNGKEGYIYSGDTKVTKFLTDDVKISGVSAPTTLSQGSSYIIEGTISSKYNVLSLVSAYVYPGSATSGTKATGTYENVNTYSYSLKNSAVDKGVVFGSLSAGSYTYCISATAKSYYCTDGKNLKSNTTEKTLHTSGFAVTGGTVSDTLSISNYNYPTSIKQGSAYSIYGTITSGSSNISSVTVGVYDSSGNMKTGKTANPNTKTYNIANLDNYVYFNNLSAGTYYYRVTAKNSAGSKQLLNKQFTVTGGSASLTVLQTIECKHRVTLPARVINLYRNPTDTSRTTYFDYGPTITCPKYAKMSDGSTMFCANVNHQGVDTQMWFKFEADMKTEVKHTFGSYQYDYAHPHAEYHTCGCGYTEYTGDYSYRDGCDGCIPRIELSTYNVYLDLRDNPSQIVDVTASGNLPSRYAVRFERSTDCISCSWNGWNGNVDPLTITARSRGSGYVTISLIDKTDGDKYLYSLSLYVSVTSPTYTVYYNANGGTNAPSSQTKYYNETLYLSEVQPYRENYEFVGWSTSSNSSYYDYLPGGSYTSNSSVTLYAVWKKHVHSYSQWPVTATCKEEGYTVYSCDCGYGYIGNYVPALGHDWDNGTVTKEPTEYEAGQKLFQCVRCTETKTEVLLALGHKHSYSKSVVAPTCTSQGYTVYTCSCGDTYKDSYTASKGHNYSNGSCVNCGIADPNVGNFHNPFEDVKEKDYFYTPVLWAVQKGVTNGTSATKFSPDAPCTRGQIVTFLWRACGSPEPNMAVNPFTDVSKSAYYYKAVLWALENGITTGTGKDKFSPEDTCTRGQVATFLWRAQGKPAPTSSNNPFNDVNSSAYYYNAILWAVEKGVTNGTGKGKFSPDASCTRGQIVTFLYRALS